MAKTFYRRKNKYMKKRHSEKDKKKARQISDEYGKQLAYFKKAFEGVAVGKERDDGKEK